MKSQNATFVERLSLNSFTSRKALFLRVNYLTYQSCDLAVFFFSKIGQLKAKIRCGDPSCTETYIGKTQQTLKVHMNHNTVVQLHIHIRPNSGTQSANRSTWWGYALFRVLFSFNPDEYHSHYVSPKRLSGICPNHPKSVLPFPFLQSKRVLMTPRGLS